VTIKVKWKGKTLSLKGLMCGSIEEHKAASAECHEDKPKGLSGLGLSPLAGRDWSG
jgi:hypothetical protein